MFKKGQSGNPKGRPKVVLADGRSLSDIAREHTVKAVATLVEIMGDDEVAPAARVSAINTLLERGWGRPAQAVEISGPDGQPVRIEDVANAAAQFTSAIAGIAARNGAGSQAGETQH